MSAYRAWAGEVTAAATLTNLSEVIGGNTQIPAPGSRIRSVRIAGAPDAAANGAACYGCRISGDGIEGTHDLVGGMTVVDGTPAAATSETAIPQETSIDVKPQSNVKVQGWFEGDDIGDFRLAVGLEFE